MLHYRDLHLTCTPAGVALLKSSKELCRHRTVIPRSVNSITAGSRQHIYIYNEQKLYPSPKVMDRASDNSFLQEVRCFRLLKYDGNHSKALEKTPTDDNLDIKIP